jgi:hypothetical protein
MFGVLSILPVSSSGQILISPGISFKVIFETMRILHDPKNCDHLQYEPIFSGNHRDINLNLLGQDKVSVFWPHNVSREYKYGHFQSNLAPRNNDLNGGDHVILARAANAIGAGASEIFNEVTAITMQNLERFIMAEFQKMYPEIDSESIEVLREEEKPYFVTHSIPGKAFESKEKIDFEKFNSDDESYNDVKLLYKNRIEYDPCNGRMKNCGMINVFNSFQDLLKLMNRVTKIFIYLISMLLIGPNGWKNTVEVYVNMVLRLDILQLFH